MAHGFDEDWLTRHEAARGRELYARGVRARQTPQQAASAPIRATIATAPKASKHRNRKTVLDGLTFDSAKEAARYQTLKLWEKVGAIRDLRLQVSYDLWGANGERVARYVSDFTYYSVELGRQVVEDVKSPHTRKLPVYRLKKKLFYASYGYPIEEV